MHFEKENSAFSNSVLKMHIIYAITQVSQGILSMIVATASKLINAVEQLAVDYCPILELANQC